MKEQVTPQPQDAFRSHGHLDGFNKKIQIPEGISCEYANGIFACKKGSEELSRKISLPTIYPVIQNNEIIIISKSSTKKEKKIIHTLLKHIENMFSGLNRKFVYKLEACNVHFPMSLKIEGSKLLISNFLGEKTPRQASILPNVNVQIKGPSITIESADKEAAGQTAGNIEKATIVKKRDRRIFQDGIYIIQKPRDKK